MYLRVISFLMLIISFILFLVYFCSCSGTETIYVYPESGQVMKQDLGVFVDFTTSIDGTHLLKDFSFVKKDSGSSDASYVVDTIIDTQRWNSDQELQDSTIDHSCMPILVGHAHMKIWNDNGHWWHMDRDVILDKKSCTVVYSFSSSVKSLNFNCSIQPGITPGYSDDLTYTFKAAVKVDTPFVANKVYVVTNKQDLAKPDSSGYLFGWGPYNQYYEADGTYSIIKNDHIRVWVRRLDTNVDGHIDMQIDMVLTSDIDPQVRMSVLSDIDTDMKRM